MKPKLSVFFGMLAGFSILVGCFSGAEVQSPAHIPLANPMPLILNAARNTQASVAHVFDLGSRNSKASFVFTLKFKDGQQNNLFTTKVSSSGHNRKTALSNLTHFKVHLLDLPTYPAGDQVFDGTSSFVKFSSGLIAATGASQSFVFRNVPATGSGGTQHYFVAIEAYEEAPAATFTNITNDTPFIVSPSNRILIDPDGVGVQAPVFAYRTDTGGDDPGSFAGSVVVDSNHDIAVAQQDAIGATLTLWDEQGAKLDSQVTVTDGSATYQGTIAVN